MGLFDVLAPAYDTLLHGTQEAQSATVLDEMGPAPGCVLDLAVGTGTLAGEMAKRAQEVVGVDLSAAMLAQARKKQPNLTLVQANAADLPFPDASFDCVTSVDSLHHFQEHDRVFAEVRRVLRPGGRWLVLDFDRRVLWTKLILAGERLLGERSRFFSPDELGAALTGIGFEVESRPVRSAEYLLVARRPM